MTTALLERPPVAQLTLVPFQDENDSWLGTLTVDSDGRVVKLVEAYGWTYRYTHHDTAVTVEEVSPDGQHFTYSFEQSSKQSPLLVSL